MKLTKTSTLTSAILCTALMAQGAYNVTTKSADAAPEPSSAVKSLKVTQNGFRKVADKQYIAVPATQKSPKKQLPVLRSGNILPLPYHLQPTEEEAELITVLDGDGNGQTFYYGQHAYGTWGLVCPPKYDLIPSDDWAWLPGAELNQTGKLYTFKCGVSTCGPIYPSIYEVLLCSDTTPESVVKTLVEETVLEEFPWAPVPIEVKFTVDEPGTYYVAIHNLTSDGEETVWTDFSLEADLLALDSPGAVTGLTATGAPLGELSCAISFDLPVIDYSGNALPADATLSAEVTSPAGSVTLEGTPGSHLTCDLEAIQGFNDITVTTYMGELLGMSAETRVFCGIDQPKMASNVIRTTDASNCVLKLTWEPPVEGLNGGYVPPMGHTYSIMQLIGDQMYILAELGEDVFSAEVPVETYGAQGAIDIGVCVDQRYSSFNYVVVGPPYIMPINEKLSQGRIKYQPIQREFFLGDDYRGTWWYGKPNWGEPDWMVEGPNPYRIVSLNYANVPTKARLTLPKFSTLGQTECSIDMEIFAGGYEQVEFLAWTHDMTAPESLLVIHDGDYTRGYHTITIDLPASMLDKGWVEIMVEPTMLHDEQCFLMGDYMVHNSNTNDLGVYNVSGLNVVHAGKDVDYTVTIGNFGCQSTTVRDGFFTIETEEGTVLHSQQLEGQDMPIEPGDMLAHTFNVVIPDNFPTEVVMKFEFAGDDDNLVNNCGSMSVKVYNGGTTTVSDLTAAIDEANPSQVTLTWSAPVVASGLETFEYDQPFNTTADYLGEFRNVDNDEMPIIGFGSFLPYPGQYQPAGFQVFSVKEFSNYAFNVDISYPVYNGDKFAYALRPDAYLNEQGEVVQCGPADDWLISPEVKGGTEVIFQAKGFNYYYGDEPFEILYSTTTDDISAFTLLESRELFDMVDLPKWEPICFTLPEDARYFAIHYIGDGHFGMCVDDIYYTPADREDIVGYDIFRNDDLIEECADVRNSFVDDTVAPDTVYTYFIIPVDAEGNRGELSNEVVVNTTITGIADINDKGSVIGGKGYLKVSGYNGQKVTVIAASGVIAAEINDGASATVSLPAGVYVVKHGLRTEKVVVR